MRKTLRKTSQRVSQAAKFIKSFVALGILLLGIASAGWSHTPSQVCGQVCGQVFGLPLGEIGDNFIYKAYVSRVIDGDTIEAKINLGLGINITEKIRFLNYDAPETFRPKSLKEKELGNQAKTFLENLIQDKQIYLIVPKKRFRGKFGRILADPITIEGLFICDIMKQKGYIKSVKSVKSVKGTKK